MTKYRIAWIAAGLALAAPVSAQGADPPARVGRLASITGAVAFQGTGADRREAATVNMPLSTGAAIRTEPSARAGIEVGRNRITLDGAAEFKLDRLDDRSLFATQPQGAAYFRLAYVPAGDSYSIATPRGVATFANVGRYEVVAGDLDHPTTITVVDGAAQVTGIPSPQQIGPNQTLTITGNGATEPFALALATAQRDAFLTAMLAAERPTSPRAPASVAGMTGAAALDEFGEWAASPDYGAVWFPPPDPNFVPYRDGRWTYVEPWGWTWVDNAPWGFAPSHYGRWAQIGGRWGWVPGRPQAPDARPVYAPAVVGFLAGASAGSLVSWAPLGPREPYRPPYPASDRYLRELNRSHVRNPAALRSSPVLINRAAATAIPPEAMTGSQSVPQTARPLPPETLRRRPELAARPPVQPTPPSAGQREPNRPGVAGAAPGAISNATAGAPLRPPPAQVERGAIQPPIVALSRQPAPPAHPRPEPTRPSPILPGAIAPPPDFPAVRATGRPGAAIPEPRAPMHMQPPAPVAAVPQVAPPPPVAQPMRPAAVAAPPAPRAAPPPPRPEPPHGGGGGRPHEPRHP